MKATIFILLSSLFLCSQILATNHDDGEAMLSECSAYPACAGLIEDCCPTKDDVFLYCCFESEDNFREGYAKEFTLVDPDKPSQATYFVSTSTYFDPATSPSGEFPVISYVRDPNELYDLVYFKTPSIPDANEYVSGNKKFYIDIYSQAPRCTQIILQLDSLSDAKPDNYPVGRHSRYFATTTKENEWERLEFDFLDRPDHVLADTAVDAIAMFFSPGLKRADVYFFKNFDSAVKGCQTSRTTNGGGSNGGFCERPSTKSCAASYTGEEGACDDGIDNDNDGLIDCEDQECTNDPACVYRVRSAYATAKRQVRAAEVPPEQSGVNVVIGRRLGLFLLLASAIHSTL